MAIQIEKHKKNLIGSSLGYDKDQHKVAGFALIYLRMKTAKTVQILAGSLLAALLLISFWLCRQPQLPEDPPAKTTGDRLPSAAIAPDVFIGPLTRDVRLRDYFAFMDSLVACNDTLVPYTLTEHLLVQANPWLIDTLENTDYYRRMARGEFVYDQQQLVVLHRGDRLILPDSLFADSLIRAQQHTLIDVNIPEFTLRIMSGDQELYTFPVRVGQNKSKYLALAGHTVDLRTAIGEGEVIRINRYPTVYDPGTGKKYEFTRRDDGRSTLMPLIPWIEPSINGKRPGHLIHPTTNPVTLGKAYSNGCVGCRESEAWRIYYHAPIGTKVRFRYDLQVVNAEGDTIQLRDIYQLQ